MSFIIVPAELSFEGLKMLVWPGLVEVTVIVGEWKGCGMYLVLYRPKSSEPAESRRKESSDEDGAEALKSVVERYGTMPRKCLPLRSWPVTARLLLVSIGLIVGTRLFETTAPGGFGVGVYAKTLCDKMPTNIIVLIVMRVFILLISVNTPLSRLLFGCF